MKFRPPSTRVSSRRWLVGASAVQPNTLPPKHSGGTWRPERPTLRYSIVELLDLYSYRKIDSLPPQLGRNSLGRFSIGLDQRKARQANPEADSV